MSNKQKSGTLSDKISDLLTSVPKSFDPEDDVYEETVAKVVEHYDEEALVVDASTSKFRQRNIDLLEDVDKRYVGKKSSRKALQDSDKWESEEEDEVSDLYEDEDVSSDDDEDANSEQGDYDEESASEGDVEDKDGAEIEENEEDEKFQHMSTDDNKSEKGQCIRNQLSFWESLLEMRIQLQKCLVSSNKMPQLEKHQQLSQECSEFSSNVAESKKHLSSLLGKFLDLQQLLQKRYPETKNLGKRRQEKDEESDEEIPSDTEDEKSSDEEGEVDEVPKKRRKLEDYAEEITERHEKYTKYRNSIIQKWHDKTKLLSGKHNTQHSVLNQIDFILSDKPKLIKRTQLKRSQYEIVGCKCEVEEEVKEATEEDHQVQEEYDSEIFDDDDFYHQLLRELIEVKSADLTNPAQLGKQWIELQNLRSKMKRKIDTKATKGRKIRYAVHSKLVNFMAPMEDNSSWTDEAKNELFSSLFGKNQIECAAV